MAIVGDGMSYWGGIARALEDVDSICPSRVAAAALWKVVTADDVEGTDAGSTPDGVVGTVYAIDRAWLVQLGQNPDMSRTSLEQATAFCQGIRAAHGRSTLLLHCIRTELSVVFGLRSKALERLREARLLSFGKTDTGAMLATARMHDDHPGVIGTTTATPKCAEADPMESTQGLGAVLVPCLAHQHIVEAEDAFVSLSLFHLPDAVSLQSLTDRLKYLGLSSQQQRAIVLARYNPMKTVSETSAWQLMNTAIELVLVMRAANRVDYGEHTLGASSSWTTPWGNLELATWNAVGHAYNIMTGFVCGIAHCLDVRNDNDGVSYRIEMRMATETASLTNRSYGAVTSAVLADRARLCNQGALLKEVRELLTLSRGYGIGSVRQRAMSTVETVSASLPKVVDDSTLGLVVDLRLTFGWLLATLGTNERAKKEHLDATELSLGQGWTEMACAALALASHAAQVRRDRASSGRAWRQCRDAMKSWPMNRPGEHRGILVDTVGDPLVAVRILSVLAEVLVDEMEKDHSRAPIIREIVSQALGQASRCVSPPQSTMESLAWVGERIAPYGRGQGGRGRPGSATAITTDGQAVAGGK